jgi:hypothetical protein
MHENKSERVPYVLRKVLRLLEERRKKVKV